jgi:hypothetical protein
MGILDAKLVETARKVTTTRNGFGDVIYGTEADRPCLYRDISMLSHAANRENVRLDGIIWFGPTEEVALGDVYYHPSEGYLRVETITVAKRLLHDNSTQFIKCGVTKQRQIS